MNHLRTHQNPIFFLKPKHHDLLSRPKRIKQDQPRITETSWSLEFVLRVPLVLYERISYCPLYLADLSRQILSFYN